ncbi:MAG: hypothetical protein V4450_11125 [Bacteroidota bacterium]
MRKLILTAILPLACLYANNLMAHNTSTTDSVRINHVTDGNLNEWRPDKFGTDNEPSVQFAVDHDATNIYIAMKVSGMPMQMKIVNGGMKLYLDKKGRKKEGTGIEFPIKKEGGEVTGRGGRPGGNAGEGGKPDPKQIKEKMAPSMLFLKTFGFDDQEDKTQLVIQEGGINIAFDWDEAGNMLIEYQVPVSYLGTAASLNGKPVGIGWKIGGADAMASSPTVTSTQLVAVPSSSGGRASGGGGGGVRSRSSNNDFSSTVDSRMREQNIWTKYTLTF